MPLLLRESRQAVAALRTTLTTADRSLAGLDGFAGPLGERGGKFFDKLEHSADELAVLIEELTIFSRSLNRGEGTLGQLVRDPELYNNVNAAARNIEVLTRELRPILYDVRVFTDKVSRDPGRLGVRGVFQQGTGVK